MDMHDDNKIDMAGLNIHLFKSRGKHVTFNKRYKFIKDVNKFEIIIITRNAFTPPFGTKNHINARRVMLSIILYFIDAICSPIAFNIPTQTISKYIRGHNIHKFLIIGETCGLL